MWNGFWCYRYLLWNLVSRDFKLKYRRSVLGVVWNILDISQTILEQGYFTMVLLVDISACTVSFPEIADKLDTYGTERGLAVRIQREDIFNAMHRI